MIPPVCTKRYLGEHAYGLLSELADWLRDQRAGKYPDLVARGVMTEDEAYVDERARASIARDWQALAADAPREPDPDGMAVRGHWKTRALEGAVAGVERRLDRLSEADPAWADWRDLRDAIATLLACQSGTIPAKEIWWLLSIQQLAREQQRLHPWKSIEDEAA